MHVALILGDQSHAPWHIYYSEFNFCKIKILENRVSYILFAKRSTLEIQQSQKKESD